MCGQRLFVSIPPVSCADSPPWAQGGPLRGTEGGHLLHIAWAQGWPLRGTEGGHLPYIAWAQGGPLRGTGGFIKAPRLPLLQVGATR